MPTRRSFLRQTAAGLSALSFAGMATRSQAEAKPNVLFIAIDDLNDWIGCLGGHPDTQTPNIDRLAKKGIVFSRCYCSAPACNPSRASLLTGIRPSTSGVYLNSQPWKPVLPEAVTLPQHFKDNGYLVYGRGKIFHGSYTQEEQSYHEYIPKGGDPQPTNRPLSGIQNAAHFDWGPLEDTVTDEDMDDTRVAHWAEGFLSKKHEKPFFLACGLFRPHLPWYNPKKYHEMFPPDQVALPEMDENDLDDVPSAGKKMANPEGDHKKVLGSDNWRKAVSSYLASIAFTDANVGRILDALEQSEYAQNTIIVLWGDHGWHLGEKLHWRKFALWEEATQMPLIISVPGSMQQNVQCGRTVTLLDLYPTLSELCSFPSLKAWEGHSLVPLLKNPQLEWKYPALTTHGRNNHSIRSERWRYIRYEDGSEELYDHEADPLEWKNLASDPKYAEIKTDHAKWLPTVNAPDAPKTESGGEDTPRSRNRRLRE